MDVSRSTLLVAALIAGFLVGLLATPSDAEATHQNLYQVSMAPPTHPTGSLAYNSCGWHDGSCYAHVDGPWMDWGHNNYSTIDYYVRFRGWFYRSNTSYSSGYVMLNVFQVYSGTDGCEVTGCSNGAGSGWLPPSPQRCPLAFQQTLVNEKGAQ